VTATPERSEGSSWAACKASATTPSMASSCACLARFGTTPPNLACRSTDDKIDSPRTSPDSDTTAAAVSSQLVSMPRT